jgi:hypothetical protein
VRDRGPRAGGSLTLVRRNAGIVRINLTGAKTVHRIHSYQHETSVSFSEAPPTATQQSSAARERRGALEEQ